MITFDPRDTVELSLPRYADDPKHEDPKIRFRVPTRAVVRRLDALIDRLKSAADTATEADAVALLADMESELAASCAVSEKELADLVTDHDLIGLIVDLRASSCVKATDRGN